MTRHIVLFPAVVLALSLACAYVVAFVFVVALQLSLPPSDLAYGQSVSATFGDPFVRDISGFVATCIGFAMFPVALFCLWHRDLIRCGFFVVGIILVYIAIATPLFRQAAFFGTPIVAVSGLIFCRLTRLSFFQPHHASNKVAESGPRE